MNNQNNDIVDVLKSKLKERNNPADLKSIIIGKVVQLEPVIVSVYEGKVLLEENDELYISEWFRFRCNIDKTQRLTSDVPNELTSAQEVGETHSFTGAPCTMPNAISHLVNAIDCINAEVLALKCNLKRGDLVAVGSLEQLDRYILLDKVL